MFKVYVQDRNRPETREDAVICKTEEGAKQKIKEFEHKRDVLNIGFMQGLEWGYYKI